MKTAVVGSRGLTLSPNDLCFYLPAITTEIVSGGAKGIDAVAKKFAEENNLKYTELLPEYEKYGKAAPIRRNDDIIGCADIVVAIWDKKSKGTKYTIDKCRKIGKSLIIYTMITDCSVENDSEYYNFTAMEDEILKEIIIKELDSENKYNVNVELIDASIDAILQHKPKLSCDNKFDKELKEELKCYYDIMFGNIEDKISP